MTLEAYAKARKEFRAKVIEHKKRRTVHLGEHVTLLFEDELTIRYQVQEMLRIERIFEEAGIEDELQAYNPLVPDGTNLKATMLIEYEDIDERTRMLAKLKGVEDKNLAANRKARAGVRDRRRRPRTRERRENCGGAFSTLRANAADDSDIEVWRRHRHGLRSPAIRNQVRRNQSRYAAGISRRLTVRHRYEPHPACSVAMYGLTQFC